MTPNQRLHRILIMSPTRFFLVFCFWLYLAVGTGTAIAEDWPRWGGVRGDNSWQAPKLPDKWPTKGLSRVWKQSIGGGYGGVAVAGGRVYVMDHLKMPEEVERVLCFDAATGQPLWKHAYLVKYGKLDYGNGPRATPTIHEGRVYTFGAVGHACCLNAKDGKPVWEVDFVRDRKAVLPDWGLAASPVVWKQTVILQPGVRPDGGFVALDLNTGKEVWRTGTDPAGYATPILINAPSGPQLVCWTPERVLGANPDTGKIAWKVAYHMQYGVSIATPIYHENLVFISGYWDGSKCIRLGKRAEEAELVWTENRFLRGLMSQPLYREGHVYSIDKQYGLTCFRLQTGKKLWDDKHQVSPRGQNPQATFVWIGDGDRAIILNELGDLILARLNPTGYQEQSRTRIIEPSESSPLWAHPAYAGDHVYARNETELVCVRLTEGGND